MSAPFPPPPPHSTTLRALRRQTPLLCARLFFRAKSYLWKSPQADRDAAEKLIHACGYHRRDEELADAVGINECRPRFLCMLAGRYGTIA